MKEENYYKPELEEFHVGFEYEFKSNFFDGTVKTKEQFDEAEWTKDTIDGNDFSYLYRALNGRNAENGLCGIRVKYLDREDIESLGFEFEGGSDYYWLRYNNGTYMLSQATEVSGEGLDFNLTIEKGGDFYFQGTIKNKSELKKVLKMLGI